jgi:hypothetical protein
VFYPVLRLGFVWNHRNNPQIKFFCVHSTVTSARACYA